MSRKRGSSSEFDPRSQARERALSLLYEAETKGISGHDVLARLVVPADDRVSELVGGVQDASNEIEALISAHAQGWTMERMPAIDRTVLRIGVYEILRHDETPLAVIIDEAVELAKRFSTEDSGRYVNGVLSAIAHDRRV